MYIDCHLYIKNVVLRNVLEAYISKTPFLRDSREPITDVKNLMFYYGDLIIIEHRTEQQNEIEYLIKSSTKKLFMVLIDRRVPYFKASSFNNAIFLPQNLTHIEFVEGLSALIDRSESYADQHQKKTT